MRPVVSRCRARCRRCVSCRHYLLRFVPKPVWSKEPGKEYSARYGWNEALHAARDRLTPPFAFRHTYEKVVRWYQVYGYTDVRQLRHEPLPQGVPESYALNVGVKGRRE